MPLGFYLDSPQGRKPVTLPTHFTLNDFRYLIEKKFGNPDHYDFSLGDVVFRTWNEEVFRRQRNAIRDGISLIVDFPPVFSDSNEENAQAWRMIEPGLCCQGVCLNVSCPAFEKKVIDNLNFGEKKIVENSKSLIVHCPMCKSDVETNSCAFYRCSWRINGVQSSNDKQINEDWKTTEQFFRWKEVLTSWKDLSIETK